MLIDHGADMLIHLGDVGSVEVIDAMAAVHPGQGTAIESHLVFGNCDWDTRALTQYANDLGVHVHDPSGVITVDGCQIAFTHGDKAPVVQQLLADEPDYLLHGHTHVLADYALGQTRVINPGALFRASRYTAALLTPASGTVQVLEIASVTR